MSSNARTAIFVAMVLLVPLTACGPERITGFDTGMPEDGGGLDARADARSDGSLDVPRDVPRDTPRDVPQDSPRDVAQDSPRDVAGDTGGGAMCPSSCTSHSECQAMCPAAAPGYMNCCLPGAGGGICYQNMGATCPDGMSGGSDGGFGFPDGGFGFPDGGFGCFGTPCSSQADCDRACGPGHMCFMFGGSGACF